MRHKHKRQTFSRGEFYGRIPTSRKETGMIDLDRYFKDCQLCKSCDSGKGPDDHIIMTRQNNHITYHGPKEIEHEDVFRDFIEAAYRETGFKAQPDASQAPPTGRPTSPAGASEARVPDSIIFKNRMAIGDILVMTCGIRDFKHQYPNTKVGVITTAGHIWDNNPYLEWVNEKPDGVQIMEIGPKFLTDRSNNWNFHHCNSFRVSIEKGLTEQLNTPIHIYPGDCWPDIWMTREEVEAKPLIDGPYWVIIIGGEPGWTAKMYPADRWQYVVDALKEEVQFVQLGMKSHPYPHLKNVMDYVGRTEDKDHGVRDLFNIFYNSQGSLGLVSMHMHLSAAFGNPCVVVAGSREPAWFTHYYGHRYLDTNGLLSCGDHTACWKCEIENCKNAINGVPKCIVLIPPDRIVEEIRNYYKGGRLEYGKKLRPGRFTNIVQEKRVFQVPVETDIDDSFLEQYGFGWGGEEIRDDDWVFIRDTIRKHNVKTCLQFGSGLASFLMASEGVRVDSYETVLTRKMKCDGMRGGLPINFLSWDGKSDIGSVAWPSDLDIEPIRKYDMALVDGPPGGSNREHSTRIASMNADIVIVHDADREWERKWQDKHLKGGFDGPEKGGHRCHLWVREGSGLALNKRTNSGACKLTAKEKIVSPGGDLECKDKFFDTVDGKYVEVCYTASARKDDFVRPMGVIDEPFSGEIAIETPFHGEVVSPDGTITKPKSLRLITTCRGWGGSERSTCFIMRMFREKGWDVTLVPTGNVCDIYRKHIPEGVRIVPSDLTQEDRAYTPSEPCDVAVLYTSDYCYQFKSHVIHPNAKRKVLVLNYRIGQAFDVDWTLGWNLYMFLNHTKEHEFIKRYPNEFIPHTIALAPPTDLEPFLKVQPDYSGQIRLIRHSAQGDNKYPKYQNDLHHMIWNVDPTVEFYYLPAPSWCEEDSRIHKFNRVEKAQDVADFLAKGNLFWYHLSPGYQDQGPRVVMEAMAAGLPVIADNAYGMTDRVDEKSGWLINQDNALEEIPELIKNISGDDGPMGLEMLGNNSRNRAKDLFDPWLWYKSISGEE